ncbi:hypothetical protein ABEB36_002072 [Hypothenemus hampei]|uniref:Mitochondrial carrier protein n=1 Tax=Hypothenemus hampei TaxID=57062 RepID=A0ABD1F4U2_HYPHA
MSQNDHKTKNTISPVRVEFLAGLGSAIVTVSITYPVTKLIYRQIIDNENEGPKILYRGSLPPMFQRCIAQSSMFGIYRTVKMPLESLHMNEYMEKISACILAGTFESLFMPLERIQMLLVASNYNKRFRNMFHVVKVMANDYGLKEFYRGYSIVLFRNISSNSCFFIAKEEIHKRVELSEISLKRNFQHFIFGSALGSFMTLLFYPVKVVKVNVHKQLGGRFSTVKEVFKEVYQKNGGGIRNFYKGAFINWGRALFSWGITNSSYEYIKRQIS